MTRTLQASRRTTWHANCLCIIIILRNDIIRLYTLYFSGGEVAKHTWAGRERGVTYSLILTLSLFTPTHTYRIYLLSHLLLPIARIRLIIPTARRNYPIISLLSFNLPGTVKPITCVSCAFFLLTKLILLVYVTEDLERQAVRH